MKNVAVVAWREIVEHRVFVWAALAALAVTLIVPLVPAFVGWSPTDVREVLMFGMALCFTWVAAVLLGVSMITGPVSAGRFGFFMSRPLTGAAVWFGKLMGVMTVLIVCELIVLVPAALLTGGREFVLGMADDLWIWIGFIVGFPLLLVLVAHAANTAWLGRSAWIALDLVVLAVVGSLGWTVVDRLVSGGTVVAAAVVGLSLVIAFVVAVLAGGLLQVSSGRCDGRRQHRVFSLAAWPLLLAFVGGIAVYSYWLSHPGLHDLEYVDGSVVVHPDGDWITVAGPARGRFDVNAQFLINLETRESVRLGIGLRWFGSPLSRVSPDRRAAWFVPDQDGWILHSGNVNDVTGGGERSAIVVDGEPQMALSSGGDRVAVIEDRKLVVSTLPEGNVLGSARLEDDRFFLGPFFWSDDRVWVLESQAVRDREAPPPVRALELDVTERRLREVGVLDHVGIAISATVDIGRDKILLGTGFEGRLSWRYLDATGFSEVPWSSGEDFGSPVIMLEDGRLVRHLSGDRESALEVLTPDGEIDARVELPSAWVRVTFGSQPTPATLVIGAHETTFQGWTQEPSPSYRVDLDSGEVSRIADRVVPLASTHGRLEMVRPLSAGCEISRTFLTGWEPGEHTQLWQWHPETGELEGIIPTAD